MHMTYYLIIYLICLLFIDLCPADIWVLFQTTYIFPRVTHFKMTARAFHFSLISVIRTLIIMVKTIVIINERISILLRIFFLNQYIIQVWFLFGSIADVTASD